MRRINLLNWSTVSTRAQNILTLVLIVLFAGINILSVRRDFSQTRDEDKHYLYGQNVLDGIEALCVATRYCGN